MYLQDGNLDTQTPFCVPSKCFLPGFSTTKSSISGFEKIAVIFFLCHWIFHTWHSCLVSGPLIP